MYPIIHPYDPYASPAASDDHVSVSPFHALLVRYDLVEILAERSELVDLNSNLSSNAAVVQFVICYIILHIHCLVRYCLAWISGSI